MHLMLQQPQPDVIATGETHTVSEFCERAFGKAGLDYLDYVKVDEQFYRPAEVDPLMGDATRARRVLGWQPRHTFEELVHEMLSADLETYPT